MPAADVGQQFRQQIAPDFGAVDQMMMRVDDRQIGLDNLFAPHSEPFRAVPVARVIE